MHREQFPEVLVQFAHPKSQGLHNLVEPFTYE